MFRRSRSISVTGHHMMALAVASGRLFFSSWKFLGPIFSIRAVDGFHSRLT